VDIGEEPFKLTKIMNDKMYARHDTTTIMIVGDKVLF